MEQLIPIIPLLPLLGFVIIGLWGNKLSKTLVGGIATSTVLGAFVLSLLTFFQLSSSHDAVPLTANLFNWLTVGNLSIDFSFLADHLSALMMLIITGIGTLIHLYSMGYMHEDEGYHKFFAYLNLFVFSMLLLVMGSNYMIMFFGWEGVGLCSYLLIGFWYDNPEYGKAARKAFIMNRIGDLGLLLGLFGIFYTYGSLDYAVVLPAAGTASEATITAITLLLFIGATGKSAQIPLYTWLPDAMAGPTPVSALIHAATMVTAGIYMVVRSNTLYSLAPTTMAVVLGVGLATSLLAAVIGLYQNDIKKVLAYSTVSQLGLMFVALGVGAYTSGMFHLTTHAFFKALLFLGAGSVIHALGGEQDIRHMGGLKKHLPTTYKVMTIGTLAIIGFPFLSGFFSKDEILAHVFAYSPLVWLLVLASSVLTAFYMLRMYFVTFYGGFRGTHDQEHHLHESPAIMTIPLWILAVLSAIGGLLNLPEIMGGHPWLAHWLGHIEGLAPTHALLSHATEWGLMALTTALVLGAMYFCYNKYVVRGSVPVADLQEKGFAKLASHKFYIDELYDAVFVKPLGFASTAFYSFFDRQLIDGFVNGLGSVSKNVGQLFRLLQNGNVEFYFFGMVLGMLALILFGIIF